MENKHKDISDKYTVLLAQNNLETENGSKLLLLQTENEKLEANNKKLEGKLMQQCVNTNMVLAVLENKNK